MMTIAGKLLILLANFFVVVLTTRLWGAEGKGVITMFVADVAMLTIVSNVFVGSSVSYYLTEGVNKLFVLAFVWGLIVSFLGGCLFHFFEMESLSLFFFIVSIFSGLFAFFNSLYIGEQKISQYNLMTVLQPVLLIVFMLLFYRYVDDSCYAYIYAMATSLGLLTVYCIWNKRGQYHDEYVWNWRLFRQSLSFGFQTELSSFLQFFNARLSYYFLNYYVGLSSVGVYSIGVTISEAVWVVSRSLSMVQYSKLLKEKDSVEAKYSTLLMAKYSGYITMAVLVIVNLLPRELFEMIFGAEFGEVKKVILLMTPGILAISVSNVFGHYFSANGKLKILVQKSLAGVIVTVLMSMLLIQRYEMDGAVWVNLLSNIVTSSVLILAFLCEKKR